MTALNNKPGDSRSPSYPMAREETSDSSMMEVDDRETSQPLIDHEMREVEGTETLCRSEREAAGSERLELPKASERTSQPQMERPRDGIQDTRKRHEASEIVRDGRTTNQFAREYIEKENSEGNTEQVSESAQPSGHDAQEVLERPPGHRKSNISDAARHNNPTTSASQVAHLNERYDVLLKKYEATRGELQTKVQTLEEKERRIESLKADLAGLQRRNEEQADQLTNIRGKYRSCQAQLDNVQRFISTADAHADQDLIQKLHGLNEEVYKVSITLTDYVAERFVRRSDIVPKTKERLSSWDFILATIGPVMVDHFAVIKEHEDVALYLEISFRAFISHILRHLVSSWTTDQKLNSLIDDMYQRLRKVETQAISGHWRALTRSHIQPTHVSDPRWLVDYTLTGLSDIITLAGFAHPQTDTLSKLHSRFGDKISSVLSHAVTFGNMVSGMISGDFGLLSVSPDTPFDRESMMDMDAEQRRSREAGKTQVVLCITRLGLGKWMGDKMIVFTKAQVVLKSFLD